MDDAPSATEDVRAADLRRREPLSAFFGAALAAVTLILLALTAISASGELYLESATGNGCTQAVSVAPIGWAELGLTRLPLFAVLGIVVNAYALRRSERLARLTRMSLIVSILGLCGAGAYFAWAASQLFDCGLF